MIQEKTSEAISLINDMLVLGHHLYELNCMMIDMSKMLSMTNNKYTEACNELNNRLDVLNGFKANDNKENNDES
jgi:hypothetical protein